MTPIAIFFSVIFCLAGIIGSYMIAKWQMRKNKIVHFFINSYDIGKGLSNEFPEFQLFFANERLFDNVMVLRGGFINSSRNDIGENGKETKFKLFLPEGSKVKAVKVFPAGDGLCVNSVIDAENKNVIEFCVLGLFKNDEFFKYTAIVEMSETAFVFNKLKFEHRIKDTKVIKNIYVGQYKSGERRYMKWFSYFCILIFGSFFVSLLHPTYQDLFLSIAQKSNMYFMLISIIISFLILLIFSLFQVSGDMNHIIDVLNEKENKK